MLRAALVLAALLLGGPASSRAAPSRRHAGPPARVVAAGQTVRGPLVVSGRDVVISGRVQGDVTVTGGRVTVDRNGEVTGNIRVVRGDVSLASGARVRGMVLFSGAAPRTPSPPRAAAPVPVPPVAGPTASSRRGAGAPQGLPRLHGTVTEWLRATSRLGLAAGVLACLVLLQVLFPHRFRRATDTTLDRPAQIGWVGCLAATSVTALAAAIFMLTQSLAGTVLALLVLGPPTLVGLATAAPSLGRRVLPPRWQDGGGTAAALTGGMLWEATLLVPLLGWILAVTIVIWGLGAFVCSFRATYPLPGSALFPLEKEPVERR